MDAESCRRVRSSGRLTCSCSRFFSFPLTLPGVVTTFRVCLPRAPALRQVLEAMLAEGALESPSVLVLAFQSSLFLVEGSSDGLAAGDRFLSPGRMCLTHSVHDEVSRFCAVSVWELAFLAPLGRTVDYCWAQRRRSSRKLLRFPWGLGLPVLSLDWVLLTSSLSFPGSSHPVCHGSLSRVSTSPVWSTCWFWLLGAGIRPVGPLHSLASSYSGVCAMRVGVPPLFPCSLWRSLASCLAAWPLPHYRWSRVHGRSSAGLIWWISAQWATVSWWYRVSWLAQGYVPLLRPFVPLLALRSSVPSGSLLRYRSESSRWGHPSGSSLSQSSIGMKALPPPSWCLVGAFAMRSPLRVEYFSDLDRNEDSSHTFPRVWCWTFAMWSPVSGRVAYFCALDRNEGFFHPPILNCFAMGSPYGSSVVFLPTRSERSLLWIAGRYSFRMGSPFSGQVLTIWSWVKELLKLGSWERVLRAVLGVSFRHPLVDWSALKSGKVPHSVVFASGGDSVCTPPANEGVGLGPSFFGPVASRPPLVERSASAASQWFLSPGCFMRWSYPHGGSLAALPVVRLLGKGCWRIVRVPQILCFTPLPGVRSSLLCLASRYGRCSRQRHFHVAWNPPLSRARDCPSLSLRIASVLKAFSFWSAGTSRSPELLRYPSNFLWAGGPVQFCHPSWVVSLVLQNLIGAPWSSSGHPKCVFLILKALFILASASAGRIGCSMLCLFVALSRGWGGVSFAFVPGFVAKTRGHSSLAPQFAGFTVPAQPTLDIRNGRLLYSVRAVRCYLFRLGCASSAMRAVPFCCRV